MKKIVFVLVLLLIISITGSGLAFTYLTSPVGSTDTNIVEFEVAPGSSVTKIANQLKAQNLIKQPLVFKAAVKYLDVASKLQAGKFELSRSMNVFELAQVLTKAKSEQISVTLLEGWRKEEVAEYLKQTLMAAGVSFDPAVFLAQPSIKEGYIFPDTYFLPLTVNEVSLAQTIEANFNQKTASLKPILDSSPYSLHQVLTMASIVERESRVDRTLVAGILWKRLENDWPLQADATLQYAKGYSAYEKKWWSEPLAVDKEIDSPYNTYANQALPPAPICNPSLSSIQAALSPEASEYWYYITDTKGNMHYAVDYDQHLANVNRYLR